MAEFDLTHLYIVFSIFMIMGIYFAYPLIYFTILILTLLVLIKINQITLVCIVVLLFILNIPNLRSLMISLPIMKLIQKLNILPQISDTEKTAIEAGSTWVEKELFSGNPNIKTIIEQKQNPLTDEEIEFLNGPTQKLCDLANDWEIKKNKGFSDEIWTFLKKEKFFGLMIPKKYGGLGFSNLAHSEVIKKIASRSNALGITVMVPNSLGPAELLTHYGTQKQKDKYLKNLAIGKEIPCFALTELQAGSDAGSMQSSGIIFKDENGHLKIKINFSKRYITLAQISTVFGLAFKLYDPENLLSDSTDCGITCALIASNTEGVNKNYRHNPLDVPFYNCPIEGKDIIIGIENVIGEEKGIGKGWKMLMECLSAGRGISLPATCTGGSQLTAFVTGAYSAIREQFGLNIGKFEGIEEPLAYITGLSFIQEAARQYTCIAVDSGSKPAVVSAIMKYHFTEEFRKVINHGMDIVGGAGISLGPKNVLAANYISAPIGITVEGANILTRTLMIFGQGAIRCHPFVYNQVKALEISDHSSFDKAFFGHISHVFRNLTKAIILFLTRAIFTRNYHKGISKKYIKKLKWSSAMFAILADIAMLTLGGNLKRKEKITGRYADILSWMYLASATIWYYENKAKVEELKTTTNWSLDLCFYNIQKALEDLLQNMGLPFKILNLCIRLNPIGFKPSDKLGSFVAQTIQKPGLARDFICQGIYIPQNKNETLQILNEALHLSIQTQEIKKKIKLAIRKKLIKKDKYIYKNALKNKIITETEYKDLQAALAIQTEVIKVDSFTQKEYLN